ncbi:MAG: hypothetical protein WCA11_05590 [Terracidiphilus sp.]
MTVKPATNNTVAVLCIISSVALMVFLFSESRADANLRIAALVSGTGLVASLIAIASTLLTGKDVTKNHDSADPIPPPSGDVTKK